MMKTTSKNDYIEMTCKQFCENNETCDKSYIYIDSVSDKTTKIGCHKYKYKGKETTK